MDCCDRGVGNGPWLSWVKRRVVFMCAWVLMWIACGCMCGCGCVCNCGCVPVCAGDRKYVAGNGSREALNGNEGEAKVGTKGVHVYGSANGIVGGCRGG